MLRFLFLMISDWLLLTLLLLEVITFFLMVIVGLSFSGGILVDSVLVVYFRVFVIEGVIGLAGLILLVSFTGSDYVRSSSTLKC